MMLNTHYYATTRLEMHKFIPEKYSRVLEIGCGCGNFSNNLRHIECEIWGIEPNKDAAKEAATKFDRVLIGNFSDLLDSIPDNYFDLVVCNDVIEHMIDHDKFFEEIKPKITQTGSFVGSIPNILYISSFYKIVIKRDWPYANEGILDRTHLRFFTYKSLKNCLLSHKYTITHYSGINSIITKGSNLRETSPLKDKIIRILTLLFIVATFGYYSDSQYLQLAFCVKKSN